jgi:hypothetical protein
VSAYKALGETESVELPVRVWLVIKKESVQCTVLKKSQTAALAFGSPGTGSRVDPNHVLWPPVTVSSLTTEVPLQCFQGSFWLCGM